MQGIQRLSGAALTKALSQGASLGALVGVVEITGFGGYMALSSIVHAIFTTAFGLTVPFGVYTGLSSMVAFLTGPIGIALLSASFFTVARGQGNKGINNRLLAMFVSMIHGKMAPQGPKPFDLSAGEDEVAQKLGEVSQGVLCYADVKNYLVSAETFLASFQSVDTLNAELSPFLITFFKAVETYLANKCTAIAGNQVIKVTRNNRQIKEHKPCNYNKETIGSFAYIIEDNPKIFLRDPKSSGLVGKAVSEYANTIRNSRSHKDAVLDWRDVEKTQAHTYKLLKLLAQHFKAP